MLSFDEALARVLTHATELGSEEVSLADAEGRVLVRAITTGPPLPPWDYSAMDGYALDTRSLGEEPWSLPVRGESRTGHPSPRLEPGTTCRIFTGAAIPEGADAVVMQENVVHEGGSARILERPRPGDHVRRAGEDLAPGAVALAKGTRLGPYQLGVLAAVDRSRVEVARRPRVAILCTGDELRSAGTPARPASIPESNSIVIAALARGAGADVTSAGIVSDDPEETRERVRTLLDGVDLLVTVGGASVGDHDVVRPALEASGVHLDFHRVAIKPGKPLSLGRRGNAIVLGLPGNPVSAQVTFALFGLPLLRGMQGDTRRAPSPRTIRLTAPIRQKPGRRGFYAAKLEDNLATPIAASSGSTTSLALADALVVVPAESEGYAAGDEAPALVLGEL